MARYVIDAPTLLHVVDQDMIVDPGHQLVAPSSIRSGALQLLHDDVRHGRRHEAAALRAHLRITERKMRLLGDRVSRATAWRLARDLGWETQRDAEYLAVSACRRTPSGSPCAMADGSSGTAARCFSSSEA